MFVNCDIYIWGPWMLTLDWGVYSALRFGNGSIFDPHSPNLLLTKTKCFCMAECCVWLDCQSATGGLTDLARIHPAHHIGGVLSDPLGIVRHDQHSGYKHNFGYLLTIVTYGTALLWA